MLSFESDTYPLSECSNPVASSPTQIVEIHCASVAQQLQSESQNSVSIVTLRQREQVVIETSGFNPELHHF